MSIPEQTSHRPRATILVVDDDPMLLRCVERTLSRLDFRVILWDRAFGLLNLIVETKPELVLLDVMMPGLDGTAVVELIRADPVIANTRVLLHSGLDDSVLARRAAQCGADGYVGKSPSVVGLVGQVVRWLKSVSTAGGPARPIDDQSRPYSGRR